MKALDFIAVNKSNLGFSICYQIVSNLAIQRAMLFTNIEKDYWNLIVT